MREGGGLIYPAWILFIKRRMNKNSKKTYMHAPNDEEGEDSSKNDDDDGYIAFEGRKVKAVLYKLASMSDETKKAMTTYVHEGFMQKDHRFARDVFGKTNTSGRRDWLDYWESPWAEEHMRDTPKKRRFDMMQKSSASRSFIKNASMQDTLDVESFMNTADRLRVWEDKNDESNENVKTVSRLVQSFERATVRNIQRELLEGWASDKGTAKTHIERLQGDDEHADGASKICHALRRSDATYDVFAAAVAMEMTWTDATSGTRNTSIHLTNQIAKNREDSFKLLIRTLDSIYRADSLPKDEIGIPLMQINGNMCVSSNGILIAGKDSTDAIYVLDMINGINADGKVDLTNVKLIEITKTFTEKDEAIVHASKERGLLEEEGRRRSTRNKKKGGLVALAT